MENFADPAKNIERLHLKGGAVVVDLGAGSGFYALAVAAKLAGLSGGGTVYAVEVQKSLLERLKQEAERRGLGNVSTIWGDIDVPNGTKLGNHIADAVVISNVLFQSETKKAFMEEALRILKPGGEVLLIDWKQHIKPEEVLALMPKNMSKVDEFDAGSHHFGMLFKKV